MKTDRRRAFSLAELLIVISIIVLLLAIATPNLKSLTGSGQVAVGVNALSAAVSSARSFTGNTPVFAGGTYDGVAVLVTPQGELRIIENVDPTTISGFNVARHPYKDVVGRPYGYLPRGVGAVGIIRGGGAIGSGTVKLLSPPFCLRFDRNGEMVVRNTGSTMSSELRAVYYDANGDNAYQVSSSRTSTISGNPYYADAYEPTSPMFVKSNFDSTNQKYRAGDFDNIETVAGVILYNIETFRQVFASISTGSPLAAENNSTTSNTFAANSQGDWLINNGTTIYFNRYTGAVIPQ